MNCSEFHLELEQSIETRTVLGTTARAHGCDCNSTACQIAWDDYLLLNQAISEFRSTTPQVDLTNQIMEKLQDQNAFSKKSRIAPKPFSGWMGGSIGRERSQSRRSAIGAGGAGGALCAVCLGACLLGFNLLSPSLGLPARTEIAPGTIESVAQGRAEDAVQLETIWAPELVSEYYMEWVEGASNRVVESLGSVAAGSHKSRTESRVEAPVSGETLLMDVWGKHLKPLEEELDNAVETLTGKSDDDLS